MLSMTARCHAFDVFSRLREGCTGSFRFIRFPRWEQGGGAELLYPGSGVQYEPPGTRLDAGWVSVFFRFLVQFLF